LEGDGASGFVESRLQATPGVSEFGRAVGATQGRGIEHLAMDGTEDVGEGDFGGRAREHVTAFLAADAADDAAGFEFEENLDQITLRDAVFGGEIFDLEAFAGVIMAREAHDGASGIITFDRQFHGRKVGQGKMGGNMRVRPERAMKTDATLSHGRFLILFSPEWPSWIQMRR
jgi:hypothetical protein